MKKKRFVLLVSLLLLLAAMPATVTAQGYPDGFWPLINRFTAAQKAGDDWAMYHCGQELISLIERQPESQFRTDFLAGKYEQFIHITERLNRFEETIDYARKYIPYGRAKGWNDGVLYAEQKIKALTPEFGVYTEKRGDSSFYSGAKFEPKSGAYFGSVYDDDPRIGDYDSDKIKQYFPKDNSISLMYLEFGDDVSLVPRYQLYFRQAKQAGTAVMLAWNTYNDMSDIRSHEAYIDNTLSALESTGLPIFLRFANEMNIGENGGKPEAYVDAFRFVADKARQKSNIAVVWSPNDVSAIDRPFEDYYPGDEYVDWIGVSCYVPKYFAGRRDNGAQTDALNTYFYTDDYANPVVRLRNIMEFIESRGINKPLMITEGGVPHYINPEAEDCTYWASYQMRRYYGELIRQYPRLKAICYFNVHMENEVNDYSLFRNEKMQSLYHEVTNADYYISEFGTDAGYRFESFGWNYVTEPQNLSCVAYYPKSLEMTVRYYLDGEEIYATDTSPYHFRFDPENYAIGQHTFTAKLFTNYGESMSKDVRINIQRSANVTLNGQEIAFADQKPVVIDSRTLVPVRGVFEQMGSSVTWIEEEQTAVIESPGHSIRVKLDSYSMEHNGQQVAIDVPAQLINDRTMVPMRVIASLMGGAITWNEATDTANIIIAQ